MVALDGYPQPEARLTFVAFRSPRHVPAGHVAAGLLSPGVDLHHHHGRHDLPLHQGSRPSHQGSGVSSMPYCLLELNEHCSLLFRTTKFSLV